MAICAESIARSSLNLLFKNVFKQCTVVATRQLYAPNTMGMNGYLNARDYVKSQFLNVNHLFFEKMKDFVQKQDDTMIFTEDLKTMMHLVEKKPEELDLLYSMMVKYNTQNNLKFGSFIFGTVAMRTFHHLDEPDLALKAFKDPNLANFFDQVMSYQLLMDLLYNHGRYQECREVYDIIKSRSTNGIVHPKNPFIIVMGACYKENTAESYQYATDLFKELRSRDFDEPRRAITFLAGLALKQNKPADAIEIVALARNITYIDVRCIKIESYVALKRIDEIIVFFRSSLQTDLARRRKQLYFKDTIEKVEQFVKDENLDESSELPKLLNQIKLHDYVQQITLEEHISSEIDYNVIKTNQPYKHRDLSQQRRFQQNTDGDDDQGGNQYNRNIYQQQGTYYNQRTDRYSSYGSGQQHDGYTGSRNTGYNQPRRDRYSNYATRPTRPGLKDIS